MDIYDIAFHNVGALRNERLEKSRPAAATIVVASGSDALSVAKQVEERRARLVLVEDVNERVTGVVFPEWVRQQVGRHRNVEARSLAAALELLEGDPVEVARSFRHEWLNFQHPLVFWCEDGEHYTDACPCNVHPSSKCVREP